MLSDKAKYALTYAGFVVSAQKLPLAVYGWAMPVDSAIKVLPQPTLPSCTAPAVLHHQHA